MINTNESESQEKTSTRIFVAINPEQYIGQSIGTGHCVPYVQEAANAPEAKKWVEGDIVQGNLSIERGTAIATFKDGKYPNNRRGNHAAIYIGQNEHGIWVFDQWLRQDRSRRPVAKRHIRFQNGKAPSMSDDGSAYSIVEVQR